MTFPNNNDWQIVAGISTVVAVAALALWLVFRRRPSVVDSREVRAGFPCTVRYQPGNPYNSIVIAEGWTGLREGLPQFPSIDDPNPIDRSHLEPGAH